MEIQRPTAENSHNNTILKLAYWLIKIGANLRVADEDKENLSQLNQELLTTSAILFIYHSGLSDAVIMPVAMRNELPNLGKMLGPVAISHYQGWQKIGLDMIGQLTGSVPIPVIRKKDEARFSDEEKTHLFRELAQKTDHYLSQPGNLYGIAPMGTRAHTLDSSKVNSSFAKLAHGRQLPAIPMALTHTNGQTNLKVGETIRPSSAGSLIEATNYYMSQLARILPLELRGDYS
ncbi:hypothetical protein KJZ63_01070 [Patescibacteria group bacterium]|nr:hypothetical protein [Patescibacteria group bacterium]